MQPAVASGIPNKLARQLLQIERLNVDSNGSGDRRTYKPRLDISGNSAKVCIDGYAPEGSDRVQFIWLKNEEADAIVAACVEINQCDGCTRQFFTKSFLGDDAAVLAPSSGEEPASPRHRAGVASMAWRSTRRFSTNAP